MCRQVYNNPFMFSALVGIFAAGVTYLLFKEPTPEQKYYKALEKIKDLLHCDYAIQKLSKSEIIEKVEPFKYNSHRHKKYWLFGGGIPVVQRKLCNA